MDCLLAMRLFVRLVELGSFSKAASAHSLKASSVSRYVTSLEQDLGAMLFRRSTRQLPLTDAGSTFYDRASAILEIIARDNAIDGLCPEKRSLSPKIRTFIEFLNAELGTPPHWEA